MAGIIQLARVPGDAFIRQWHAAAARDVRQTAQLQRALAALPPVPPLADIDDLVPILPAPLHKLMSDYAEEVGYG